MNVLVIGSGAREHALCWKLSQSPHLQKLFCAPGNSGIGEVAELLELQVNDVEGIVNFVQRHQIDLTVVGPELPLSLGLADILQAKGRKVFGPSKAAARLEWSKEYAKEVMQSAGVPTPKASVARSADEASALVEETGIPVVLKADGLASGKGVVVCRSQADVDAGISYLFNDLGAERVLVEEFLSGVEASFIVAANGEVVVPFAASHDYKRIGEGNTGPNTGGMGAISPTPFLEPSLQQKVEEEIVAPVLREMVRRGEPFLGFLYAGLMISEDKSPKVIEFNVRFGDPECQAVLCRLESDLLSILLELLAGNEPIDPVKWSPQHAVCLVQASAGYPTSSRKGDVISGVREASSLPGVEIFHAGTKMDGDTFVTNGGRVLSVTTRGDTLDEALAQAYQAAEMIKFDGCQYRRDLGGPNSDLVS